MILKYRNSPIKNAHFSPIKIRKEKNVIIFLLIILLLMFKLRII